MRKARLTVPMILSGLVAACGAESTHEGRRGAAAATSGDDLVAVEIATDGDAVALRDDATPFTMQVTCGAAAPTVVATSPFALGAARETCHAALLSVQLAGVTYERVTSFDRVASGGRASFVAGDGRRAVVEIERQLPETTVSFRLREVRDGGVVDAVMGGNAVVIGGEPAPRLTLVGATREGSSLVLRYTCDEPMQGTTLAAASCGGMPLVELEATALAAAPTTDAAALARVVEEAFAASTTRLADAATILPAGGALQRGGFSIVIAEAAGASSGETMVALRRARAGSFVHATVRTGSAPSGGMPAPAPMPTDRSRSPIGGNLTSVVDWETSYPFVDAFKASRPWISGNKASGAWDDGRAIETDPRGWPVRLASDQVARTLLFWDLGANAKVYPKGRYTVTYRGKGKLTYAFAARKVEDASTSGRDVIEVDPTIGGVIVNLEATDPSDPVRDVKVLMPGGRCERDVAAYCTTSSECGGGACRLFADHPDDSRFHPTFLAGLDSYRVIRFMDWMATNNSTARSWSDRPRVEDARYSVKGVPVEIILELANLIGADPWLNVPHLADDDYVRSLAAMVAQKLDPRLKAYVEHSNEVWNAIFTQFRHVVAEGRRLGLASTDFEAAFRYHARRSLEIFRIFQAHVPADRLVRVLGAFSANDWMTGEMLALPGVKGGVDALAIAPYFGHDYGDPRALSDEAVRAMTTDQLLDRIEREDLPKTIAEIGRHAAKLAGTGIALVAYEGGQHLSGILGRENDDRVNALFDAANRSPRMGEIYRRYLDGWRDAGGTLFVNFSHCGRWSKWGRWGTLEYQDQALDTAPKMRALLEFAEANPIWW